MRAQKGIGGALLVDATRHGGPTRRAACPFTRDTLRERGIAGLDVSREGEIPLGVFVTDPEAGAVGQCGEAQQRVVELRGGSLEEAAAACEKKRVAREGVPSTDVRDCAERVTGHVEHVQRRVAQRQLIPFAYAARLARDAPCREIVRAADDLDAGMGRAQSHHAAGVVEVVVRAPDRGEAKAARCEEIVHRRRLGRVYDDRFAARGAHEQIGVVVVQQGNRDDVDRGLCGGGHAATIRAPARAMNRDIVARVSSSPDAGFQKRKRALVVLTVVATPLALGMETLVRTQVFPLLMGGDFDEVRAILGPLLTPVAWGLCGVAILANLLGFALYERIVARAIAKLPPERQTLSAERERAALGAFLLAASVPQVPCILSTLTFTFGAPLMPVVVGVALGSLGVVAQALRTRRPA